MLRRKILLMAGILVLTVLAVTGYIQGLVAAESQMMQTARPSASSFEISPLQPQGLNATASCKFLPHSLIGASLDDVRKAALDLTCAKFEIFRGTPEVRLARYMAPVEYINLIPEVRNYGACQDQQLALVILKGDFSEKPGAFPGYVDVTKLPHFEYLGFVFDLRVGDVMEYLGSPHGEEFRTILNDPTIPTKVPAPTPKDNRKLFAAPTLPNPKEIPPCNYGTIAPPLVPPITPKPATPTPRPYLPPPP